MPVSVQRIFIAGCLAAAVLAGLSLLRIDSAFALTAREAEAVVSILEELKADDVQIAYDGEAADDWFEQDAEDKKLIAKAGFSQATWKRAVDETMTGFFATIPDAEIKTIFEDLRKQVDAASDMTAEQKKAMHEMWAEQRKQIVALREKGKPFQSTVAPLADRLRKLTFD